MNWRQTENRREIVSGDYHIHKSLDKYTAYRRSPFINLGLYSTAKKAKKVCKNDSEDRNIRFP